MSNSMRHHMELARFYRDGAQEWVCPVCGHRILFHWTSHWASAQDPIILEAGDIQAHPREEQAQRQPSEDVMVQHESGLSEVWLDALA